MSNTNNPTSPTILAEIAAHARNNGAHPESIPAIQRELAGAYSFRNDGYITGPHGVNGEAYMRQWLAANPHYVKPKSEPAAEASPPQQRGGTNGTGHNLHTTEGATAYVNDRIGQMLGRTQRAPKLDPTDSASLTRFVRGLK
jgi:hypothetical protein